MSSHFEIKAALGGDDYVRAKYLLGRQRGAAIMAALAAKPPVHISLETYLQVVVQLHESEVEDPFVMGTVDFLKAELRALRAP